MKKIALLSCLIIVIFLVGCGPSSEVLAVTMVAQTDVAATQTRAAVPTSTPTPTSTPVPTNTPTPTNTPVPTNTPTPTRTEHLTPGPPPPGLPQAETSEYLQTNFGGFSISLENFTITCTLSLSVIKELPAEAFIEAHFENPSDPLNPIVVTQQGPQPEVFELHSPPLTALKRKNYWVEVIIYSGPDKETELGRHLQWIQFSF